MDTAVILAGGFGTRLRPLTNNIPKPLLAVSGQPLLKWTLDNLKKYSIKRVIFALHHHANKIKEYFGQNYNGMKIIYYIEKEPLGTAGVFNHIFKDLKDDFLQVHGDILSDINIDEMIKLHEKEKTLCTIALVNVDDPTPFSSVALEGNKITKFVFKPKTEEAPSNLVYSGLSIINPKALSLIKNKNVADLDNDIFKKLVPNGEVVGYLHKGKWFPIDTIDKYAIANAYWNNS